MVDLFWEVGVTSSLEECSSLIDMPHADVN